MLCVGHDEALLRAVLDRKPDEIKAAVLAGARVNASPEARCPPAVAATMIDHVGMLQYLLEHGADPDRPVTGDWTWPRFNIVARLGERPLHIASIGQNVDMFRLLLNRGRADPNVTDNIGRTPLMVSCLNPFVKIVVARLLLDAGADPTLAEEQGVISL
ncbi:unnamed protein product, partial [Laminaria digitata]